MSGCCCNETNPSTVDVTVENNTYEGLAPVLAIPVGTASIQTIGLSMPSAGRFYVKAWLVDALADYFITIPSANFVNTPSNNVWSEITAADGTYTFTIEKTGGNRSYRLICEVGGVVVASEAFTVG